MCCTFNRCHLPLHRPVHPFGAFCSTINGHRRLLRALPLRTIKYRDSVRLFPILPQTAHAFRFRFMTGYDVHSIAICLSKADKLLLSIRASTAGLAILYPFRCRMGNTTFISFRIQKRDGFPAAFQRTGFSFTITNHTYHYARLGLSESCTCCMCQAIASSPPS